MKEQMYAKGNELCDAAVACGIDFRDAFDDVADSIDTAVKAVPSISQKDPDNTIQKYWSSFLRTYSGKCQKRWFTQCGKSEDYESMEKLWMTSFEPVWIAGCNVAKQTSLQNLSELYRDITSRSTEKLNKDSLESFKKWNDDLVAQFDEVITKVIAEYKDLAREATSHSLRELKGYDKDSFLGKLKRWMSSR